MLIKRVASNSNFRLRQEMLATAQLFPTAVIGTAGNLSCRVPDTDTILITPSNMRYEQMGLEHFVEVDFDGTERGIALASVEKWLHIRIAQAYPAALWIVHLDTHSAPQLQDDIPAYCHRVFGAGGNSIRITRLYENPGSDAFAMQAVDALKNRRACVHRKHGVTAYGKSGYAALALARWTENLARGWIEYSQYCKIMGREPQYIEGEEAVALEMVFSGYDQPKQAV